MVTTFFLCIIQSDSRGEYIEPYCKENKITQYRNHIEDTVKPKSNKVLVGLPSYSGLLSNYDDIVVLKGNMKEGLTIGLNWDY